MKAGLALAPDAFGLVLDGESLLETVRSQPVTPNVLAEKVKQYEKSISKCSGHLKRLGNVNDRER